MSKAQFIKLSGLAFIAGSFPFVAMMRGSLASPILSSILLAAGLLGLRAGYGESVGKFGRNVLLMGAIGAILWDLILVSLIVIGISGILHLTQDQGERFWIVAFGGPAVALLALTLFGLTALRRKPMFRFNWLPVLAGIWYPVIYFLIMPYLFTKNETFPDQYWSPMAIMILIQFLALCLLGFTLVTDVLDVDILINRTLVYGALTVSIVSLYVLIVGGFGILFQTQNNLLSIVIAILLITYLFQPLRRRLQRIADHFVPVPQSTSASEHHEHHLAIPQVAGDTTMRDPRLFVARNIPNSKQEIDESQLDSEIPARQHWRAWLIFSLTYVLSAISLVFLALSWTTAVADMYGFRGDAVLLALAFSSIGLLLARRHSQNSIGWLLLVAGLFNASVEFCIEYAAYSLITIPGTLPGGTLTAWMASWLWVIAIALLIYTFLLFPTGHLPSARWRPVAWFVVVAFALTTLIFMIRPGPLYFAPYLDNPFAVQPIYRLLSPFLITGTGAILLIGISIILRFQSAQGIERQQLKWFAYAAMLMTMIGITDSLAGAAGLIGRDPKYFQYLTIAIWIAIPFAIAFAILRYRLWDIDILINRTLVYGALTASVVGLYILIVGGLGTIFQMQNSLPGIVIAILLIALVFQPLRRRLQGIVNRFVPVPQPALSLEQHEHNIMILKREGAAGIILAWMLFGITSCGFVFGIAQSLFAGQASQGGWLEAITGLLWSLVPLVFALMSALIISRQARNMIGWLLIINTLLFMLDDGVITPEISRVMTVPDSPSLALFLAVWFGSFEWVLMIFPPFLIVFLFPTGAPPSPRWRWVITYVISLVVFFITVTTFVTVLPPNRALFSVDWSLVNPIGFIPPDVAEIIFSIGPYLALASLTVLCIASLYVRYRRAETVEKKQIQWLLFASGLFALVLLTLGFTQSSFLLNFLFPIVMMGIPVSIGIAILRYRLWDIDLIINRTLVYGALTVGIIVLYILVVGALGIVSQTIGNLMISLLATGLIAFLFQPLRERLQRGVNHLLYGERVEPYVVLSQLGQRLETVLAPTAILSTTVETIGRALKLPFVEIRPSDDQAQSVSFGEPQARTIAFPLGYQNETIGELYVAPRAGESLSNADQNLLKDLARQMGIAIHAARVTADLQRSRERLVLAREEERRRLRRDLHDDLAPTLASLGLTASTVADLIPTNPTTATKLVKELQAEIRATVGNIRRLVYDLRPPTLDELGLLAAVRERAAQYSNAPDGFHVTVDAPAELPALPAAVEVAAYRIVQEALENVSKHSQARQCTIRFTNHNGLVIEITDDGIGLPTNITPGVGLRSMRERAEELGGSCVIECGMNGGTRVLACLPMGEFDGTFTRPDRG